MGCRDHDTVDKMRTSGIGNVMSPYFIAAAPTSTAIKMMQYPELCCIKSVENGIEFVERMYEWGADYISLFWKKVQVPDEEKAAYFQLRWEKPLLMRHTNVD